MGQPTEKMIAKLAEFGIDANGLDFALASEMIGKIARNQWRLPYELADAATSASSRNRDPAENSYYGRYKRRFSQGGFAGKSKPKAGKKANRRKPCPKLRPEQELVRRTYKVLVNGKRECQSTVTTVTPDPSLLAPWEEEGESGCDGSLLNDLEAEGAYTPPGP